MYTLTDQTLVDYLIIRRRIAKLAREAAYNDRVSLAQYNRMLDNAEGDYTHQ